MRTRDETAEAIVFRIHVSTAGWTVSESYCRHSVADFDARDDALEYATTKAQNQAPAVVEVYGDGGLLEARSKYGGR